jgi:Imm-5 like putative immunity protein
MGRQPGTLTLSEDDRRVLAAWAADCAERTLSLFEAEAPNDPRPRAAIDGLRAFARGELRIGPVRALAARAHAAAREVSHPAAVAAPREAGWQLRHASPAVREVLRRLPPPGRAAGVLGSLINDLHTKLTTG